MRQRYEKLDIGVVDIQVKAKFRLGGVKFQVGFNSEFSWAGIEPVETSFGEAIYAYFKNIRGFSTNANLQEAVDKINEGYKHPALSSAIISG